MADGDSLDSLEAGPAALLLGLSSSVRADAQPEVQPAVSEPPPSPVRQSEAAHLAEAPNCTPAVVAAALMSASTVSETDNGTTTAAAVAAAASASLSDPTKNRRLQVSALPRKEWSAREDALIRSGVEQMGCRWRVIAAQLPGRSDDAVRNRWSRLQDSQRGGSSQSRRASTSSQEGESSEAVSRERASGGSGSSSRAAVTTDDVGAGGDDARNSSDGGCVDSSAIEHAATKSVGINVEGRDSAIDSGRGNACGSSGGAGGIAARSPHHKPKGSGSKAGGRRHESGGGGGDGSSSGGGAGGAGPPEKKERTSWTRAEDDVIIQGVADLGHKWYEIARRLPGRTDHAIRNRWSRLQSIIGMQSMSAESSAQPSPQIVATLGGAAESANASPYVAPLHVPLPPPAQPLPHQSGLLATQQHQAFGSSVLSGFSPSQVPALKHEAVVSHSSLSTAALASKVGDGASGGSDASDAELTSGTAELLLLQSGGAPSCQPSCQPSPQSSAAPRPSEECPDIPAGPSAHSPGLDLLLLTKRPRV
uniref:Uncharacterized protein n=1 Tax=Haptolina brevifila TaxID=156173 RepID=A0A7S2ITY3_9EUKA|mmetsp:Transcript_71106/g.140960  ORF Transcript_71106/g.140960 Transcript_71106/m.140960 type:complete len:535 (+) Transcript_71106:117-1721(+)